ncbi:hypothetical protein AB4Z32_14335 [Massilia sp. 2TAF26]|uniref:hypothetical protein n=1 Tax=Massilia sp. 2TAF26 TaxID=3233012 RepID=UPI003F97E08E
MELNEFLLEKLFEARQYIVNQAKNGSINEKEWADSWLEGHIDPPSILDFLLPNDDGAGSYQERINKVGQAYLSAPAWVAFLTLYSGFLQSYKEEGYGKALNQAFFIQFQLGKAAGKLEEQRKSIQASADKKTQPARDAAFNYYKKYSLENLKAPAAADILLEHAGTGRQYDTLYDYVLFYRKRIKLIKAAMPKYRESLLSTFGADKDETGSIAKMVEEEVLRFQTAEINSLRFLTPKPSKRATPAMPSKPSESVKPSKS